ncbi:MAG: alpha/beta fold hydrolase [Thermoplasmatota archaeon]
MNAKRPVLFVPGGQNPAAVTFAQLLPLVASDVEPLLKDHELYAGPTTPPGRWSLTTEVEAIRAATEARGWDAFDVVAYSGGGGIALAFLERYGERVRSLALIEPAWVGPPATPEEREAIAAVAAIRATDAAGFMVPFMRAYLRPGVPLPPPPSGPPPAWMAKRPAGFRAFMSEFASRPLDYAKLRAFTRPVLVAVGTASAEVEEVKAKRLAAAFPDCRLEFYEGLHHFAPPHRDGAPRFADSLRALWSRGDLNSRAPA